MKINRTGQEDCYQSDKTSQIRRHLKKDMKENEEVNCVNITGECVASNNSKEGCMPHLRLCWTFCDTTRILGFTLGEMKNKQRVQFRGQM